jgi:hypothetical protein
MSKTRRKIPIVAGILSLLLPGLGYLYAEEKRKGYFCLALTLGFVCMWSYRGIYFFNYFNYGRLTFYLLGLWICIVGDSYRDAILYNNRLAMQEGFEQQEALKRFQRKNPYKSPENTNPPST